MLYAHTSSLHTFERPKVCAEPTLRTRKCLNLRVEKAQILDFRQLRIIGKLLSENFLSSIYVKFEQNLSELSSRTCSFLPCKGVPSFFSPFCDGLEQSGVSHKEHSTRQKECDEDEKDSLCVSTVFRKKEERKIPFSCPFIRPVFLVLLTPSSWIEESLQVV